MRRFGKPSNGDLFHLADGRVNNPRGMALYDQELLVIDTFNHRIQGFHQETGRFLRRWGQEGKEDGEFILPMAASIAVDFGRGEEKIFVLDSERRDVQVFRLSDARFLNRFPIGSSPQGIAVVGQELFVYHDSPPQIDVMTRSEGKHLRVFWKSEDEEPKDEWFSPSKLFVDQDMNELFLIDSDDGKNVKALDLSSGQVISQYGGLSTAETDKDLLDYPRAVVAHGEEVIVADTLNHRLVVFDRSTRRLLRTLGQRGTRKRSEFLAPSDLLVHVLNQLFVCDTGNSRVLMFE